MLRLLAQCFLHPPSILTVLSLHHPWAWLAGPPPRQAPLQKHRNCEIYGILILSNDPIRSESDKIESSLRFVCGTRTYTKSNTSCKHMSVPIGSVYSSSHTCDKLAINGGMCVSCTYHDEKHAAVSHTLKCPERAVRRPGVL